MSLINTLKTDLKALPKWVYVVIVGGGLGVAVVLHNRKVAADANATPAPQQDPQALLFPSQLGDPTGSGGSGGGSGSQETDYSGLIGDLQTQVNDLSNAFQTVPVAPDVSATTPAPETQLSAPAPAPRGPSGTGFTLQAGAAPGGTILTPQTTYVGYNPTPPIGNPGGPRGVILTPKAVYTAPAKSGGKSVKVVPKKTTGPKGTILTSKKKP